jgi:hypothetical protein
LYARLASGDDEKKSDENGGGWADEELEAEAAGESGGAV